MSRVNMKELLEAGVHFGHQTTRWNPKMKPYIFGARNGIHIIDLQKTVECCEKACAFVEETVAQGKAILFVGTKRQAQEIVEKEAQRAQQFYVTQRWLGGTLTNFETIRKSVEKLKRLEKMKETEGGFTSMTKKEIAKVEKEIVKLQKALGGIKEMKRLPGAVFVVDPKMEYIAVHEANILGVPVVAIVDTNSDPDLIDYVIPGNDDAIRSIKLFAEKVAEACVAGLGRRQAVEGVEQPAQPQPAKAAETPAQPQGLPGVEVETRIRLAEDLMPEAARYAEEWDGADTAAARPPEAPAATPAAASPEASPEVSTDEPGVAGGTKTARAAAPGKEE